MSSAARKLAPITVQPASISVTFAHFEMPDMSLCGAGVLPGDTAVVLLNADIQSRDLVLVHTPEGLQVLQYHAAPEKRIKLRTLEYKRSRRYVYTEKEAVILGRVAQFVCNEKPVQLLIELRPVR